MSATPRHCDVAVIGGGPAGAATALTLVRAGRSVVMLEKSRYDVTNIGETLPPRARAWLERLGVWRRFVADGHRPSPAVLSAWGDSELQATHHVFSPYGQGWHVDRRRFDAMLGEAASNAGVRVRCGTTLGTCESLGNDGWRLELTPARRTGGGEHLHARCVVDATGRVAVWARRQGAKRVNSDRLVAIAGLLVSSAGPHHRSRGDPARDDDDAHTLVEASASGWWYSAALPRGRTVATYITDVNLLPTRRSAWVGFWHDRLGATRHTCARLRWLRLAAAPRLVAANSSRLDHASGTGWLAAGDAAMAFDPLSSRGLTQALASGVSAGDRLHRYLDGQADAMRDWDTATDTAYREYLRQRAVNYATEQRWPHSIFWRRRHAATDSENVRASRTSTPGGDRDGEDH